MRKPTKLELLSDAVKSIWTKICKECFQHLVESLPLRIKVVLKAKQGFYPFIIRDVYLRKWLMTV